MSPLLPKSANNVDGGDEETVTLRSGLSDTTQSSTASDFLKNDDKQKSENNEVTVSTINCPADEKRNLPHSEESFNVIDVSNFLLILLYFEQHCTHMFIDLFEQYILKTYIDIIILINHI